MFKITLQYATMLATVVASLAACDGVPLAPTAPVAVAGADASVSAAGNYRGDGTVQHSFVQYSSCANGGAGEVLQISGQLTYSGQWITSPDGQHQLTVTRARFTGVGTGWDTGDVYDITTREFSKSNTEYGPDGIPDNSEELQQFRLSATNRATHTGFEILLVGRFVQTPQGEPSIAGWTGREHCQ